MKVGFLIVIMLQRLAPPSEKVIVYAAVDRGVTDEKSAWTHFYNSYFCIRVFNYAFLSWSKDTGSRFSYR